MHSFNLFRMIQKMVMQFLYFIILHSKGLHTNKDNLNNGLVHLEDVYKCKATEHRKVKRLMDGLIVTNSTLIDLILNYFQNIFTKDLHMPFF